MAFTEMDKYTALALEKGLASAIKVGDCRFQSYGADNKKKNADDEMIGPVAYVVLADPKNADPDIAAIGTVTKLFYNCDGTVSSVKFETTTAVANAVSAAKTWVEQSSIAVAALRAKIPA